MGINVNTCTSVGYFLLLVGEWLHLGRGVLPKTHSCYFIKIRNMYWHMRNRVLIMLKFGFVINKEREGNKVLLAKHIGEAYYDFITTLVNLHVLLV